MVEAVVMALTVRDGDGSSSSSGSGSGSGSGGGSGSGSGSGGGSSGAQGLPFDREIPVTHELLVPLASEYAPRAVRTDVR